MKNLKHYLTTLYYKTLMTYPYYFIRYGISKKEFDEGKRYIQLCGEYNDLKLRDDLGVLNKSEYNEEIKKLIRKLSVAKKPDIFCNMGTKYELPKNNFHSSVKEYHLSFRRYFDDRIRDGVLPGAEDMKIRNYSNSYHDRLYKNILRTDLEFDVDWFTSCQKYIETLNNRERYALKSISEHKPDSVLPLKSYFYEAFHIIHVRKIPEMIKLKKGISGTKMNNLDSFKKIIQNAKSNTFGQAHRNAFEKWLLLSNDDFDVDTMNILENELNKIISKVLANAPKTTKDMVLFEKFNLHHVQPNQNNVIHTHKKPLRMSSFQPKNIRTISIVKVLKGKRCLATMGLSTSLDVLFDKGSKSLIGEKFNRRLPIQPKTTYCEKDQMADYVIREFTLVK